MLTQIISGHSRRSSSALRCPGRHLCWGTSRSAGAAWRRAVSSVLRITSRPSFSRSRCTGRSTGARRNVKRRVKRSCSFVGIARQCGNSQGGRRLVRRGAKLPPRPRPRFTEAVAASPRRGVCDAMRDPLKPDDVPVLAAWLLWEMFCGDDDGVRDTRVSDSGASGKREPRRLRDRDRVANDTGAPLQLCCFRRVSGTRHRTARRTRNGRGDRRASSLVVVRT